MKAMKASESIKAFIRQCEGLRLTAYRCPSGVWTIGYGHTGADVTPGKRIIRAEAERLMEADLARFECELGAAIGGVKLRQGQYDALLSFAYNVGMANLKASTLWRKVQADADDASIPAEFSRWVYGTQGGRKVRLPGLIKRRAEEARRYASR